MYRSLFPGDMFADLDRLQRQMQRAFELTSPSIRGFAGGSPALNVGSTPDATEIYVFTPGIDPSKVDVTLDRGALTIAGERPLAFGSGDAKTNVHINERYHGRFRRVVNLPDSIDPGSVAASYKDGVLHISVKHREAPQPRRIDVQ